YNGKIVAVWSGNTDAEGMKILSSSANIATGPRIVASNMGPVTNQANNTTFLADGTKIADTIDVTFDRPVDPNSFGIDDVTVSFRPNTLSPTQDPDGIFLKVGSVLPLNTGTFGPAQITGTTRFRIKFDPFTTLNAGDQAFLNLFPKTGTYS